MAVVPDASAAAVHDCGLMPVLRSVLRCSHLEQPLLILCCGTDSTG